MRVWCRNNVDQLTLAMFNILKIMSALVCVEIVLYPTKYNENLIQEFYSNLTIEVESSTTTFGAIYARGIRIAFTSSNIASFFNCPHTMQMLKPLSRRGILG